MKHTADTLRNVIFSCHSIRDARNFSHVCSDCCYGATGASVTAREAPCTHVCHMGVHSKRKVPTAKDNHEVPQSHHTSSAADTPHCKFGENKQRTVSTFCAAAAPQ
jgi:hypothetical protein